ncbi:MAG TPA: hypothetical protein VLJ17_17660 [Xanthobacteraceae bacterium]|nr:hypothetical protein [Xanthobacteraceae bacterium]
MSARKVVAAKVATKTTRKGAAPASPKRASVKEVAGKPAAPTSKVADDASVAAKKLAADIDRALAQGQTDLLTVDAIQALMAAACRSYSAQVEAGGRFPPLADRSCVTSTDVMVTASGLLKSANLAVFELGMWQSWTGR